MADGVSNDPVIASTPTPLSVEPRVAAPAEVAEVARQAEEAKIKAAEPAAKAEPKSEEKTKPSIRDAIRAAEKKVNAEPVAAAAKPLSVAATEAKTAEPVAKAEPAAAPRGEDGKFVSSKPAEPAVADAKAEPVAAKDAKTAEPAAKAEPVAKPAALPSHTASPPPARFSAAAKEKWAEAPEEVRAETERAVNELTKGFEKNRAAAERDGTLAEFHDMAGKSGKVLKDVVANYVGMENLLRTDTIKGLELICQNAGLSLREVAAKVLGQTPDQNATAQDATIRDLNAKIARLEQGLGSIEQERAQAKTDTTTESVTKFAAEHPRFEELANDIAFFLKTRTKNLAEAYDLAERLNPVTAAKAPAPEPAAAVASSAPVAAVAKPTLVPPVAHTDAGARSIAGTPTAGSDPVRKQPSTSIKEAIRRATAAAR